MYCYLLSNNGRSYIGATVNLDKRLKQHNGELAGGAKYTKGRVWNRLCHISGFNSWSECLKFEWRWKWLSKKVKGDVVTRRMIGLKKTIEWFGWYHLEIILENYDVWEYVARNIDDFDYNILYL